MKVQIIQKDVASHPKISIFIGQKNLYSSTDCDDNVQHFLSLVWFNKYFLSDQFCVFSIRGAAALQLPWTALPRRSWFVRPEPGRHAHARAEKRERHFPPAVLPITLHMWTGGFLHMPPHVEVFLHIFNRHKACLQAEQSCEQKWDGKTHIRSLPEESHLAWVDVTFSDFTSLSWAYFLCKWAKILICWCQSLDE